MREVKAETGWCVYMLRCQDGTIYTGATNDLAQRVKRHQSGKGASYTRSRLPVRLVFQELVLDRSAALRREAALKKLTRQEKLKMLRERRGSTGLARTAAPTTRSKSATVRPIRSPRGSASSPGRPAARPNPFASSSEEASAEPSRLLSARPAEDSRLAK